MAAPSSGAIDDLDPAIEWTDVEYKISVESFGKTAARRTRSRLGISSSSSSSSTPSPNNSTPAGSSNSDSGDVVSIDMSSESDEEMQNKASDTSSPTVAPHERILIQKTSGIMPKGKFIAIMGSSGAGKTTFLNMLSGQLKLGWKAERTGTIRVQGRRLTKDVFQEHCAYVQQFDALTPLLTVQETVMFHAHMRLPATMSWQEKQQRANGVIQKLGLEHVRNSRIGDEYVRGISGGERRRVSIAIEMVSNPDVLFLDEPTSGLDSKTSLNLAMTLSDLAHNHGHTVVCTIHQPRSQIFEQFDYLMLLAKGHIVYYGEASQAIHHFASLGFPCPTHENPADFFIDLLTLDSTSDESAQASQERVEQIIEASKVNAGSMVLSPELQESRKRKLTTFQSMAQMNQRKSFLGFGSRGAYWFMQVFWLWLRATLCILRNPGAIVSRFAPIVTAVVTGLLWLQMDNDQTTVSDRSALLFLSILGVNFPEAFAALVIYPMERAIYQRETENRVYSASAYWLATQLAQLPMQIIAPIPFLAIVYWMTGLQTEFEKFVAYVVAIVLSVFCANSVGMFFGALIPAQIASICVPAVMVLLFLVGGFFLNPENMADWLYWTRYLSWFTYTNDALVTNEFSGKSFYCKEDQFNSLTVNATCAGTMQVITNSTRICPITDGQQVIDERHNDRIPIFANVLILFGWVVLFRCLLYLPLRYAKPKA